MRKSREEQGRPGIIHHVSDDRWTRDGHRGAGLVVISAGPEAVHHPVGSVQTLRLVKTLTQLRQPVLNLFAVGTQHNAGCD